MTALTELTIRKLPHPASGSTKHLDPSLPGFGVRCTTRSKSFFVMFGEERRMKTLGKWPDLALKDARHAAKGLLASPPKIAPRMPKMHQTRDRFLSDCKERLRKSTVDRYYFSLKDLPDTRLDRVSKDVDEPNQLKALKVFFNWCIDHGITDHNPFLRRRVQFGVRDRLLTDEEVAAIWAVERKPYTDIVKLLILTGQRRNQIWRYQPDWLDNAADTLTFPASIMKSKRSHTIPVTAFKTHLPLHPFSFNGWSKSKVRLDSESSVTNWVLHDLRRYFSSTMARLGVPLHITENLIDHRSQISGVAAIYNRYSYVGEMRKALQCYEEHVFRTVAID